MSNPEFKGSASKDEFSEDKNSSLRPNPEILRPNPEARRQNEKTLEKSRKEIEKSIELFRETSKELHAVLEAGIELIKIVVLVPSLAYGYLNFISVLNEASPKVRSKLLSTTGGNETNIAYRHMREDLEALIPLIENLPDRQLTRRIKNEQTDQIKLFLAKRLDHE